MANRLGPGCRCCSCATREVGDGLGFEVGVGPQVEVVEADEVIPDLTNVEEDDFLDTLYRCKVVFAGNYYTAMCGPGIRFPRKHWREIRCWVRNGGRFWLNSEYNGCLANVSEVDAFMRFINAEKGESEGDEAISHGDDSVACGCRNGQGRPGSAGIAQGVSTITFGCFNSLTGGVPFAVFPGDQNGAGAGTFGAVRRIYKGFLAVVSDSNVWGSCGGDEMLTIAGNFANFESGAII